MEQCRNTELALVSLALRFPVQCSLVLDESLDLVHQLSGDLEDVLHIVTLSHLCGTHTHPYGVTIHLGIQWIFQLVDTQ